MAAQAQAAYGMYHHGVALNDVLSTLNHGGFHDENICMMLSPTHPIATVVKEANVLNAEREENIATAGLIGWLAKFGAVVIPTVGFFIRSPKFFHAVLAEKGPMARCGSSTNSRRLGFHRARSRTFRDPVAGRWGSVICIVS